MRTRVCVYLTMPEAAALIDEFRESDLLSEVFEQGDRDALCDRAVDAIAEQLRFVRMRREKTRRGEWNEGN